MRGLQPSAIRRMLEVSARPGMISFAGGLPASDLFDVEGFSEAFGAVMCNDAKQALQDGSTTGVPGLREAIVELVRQRGVSIERATVIVTTGAQQALDLVARTMVDPGDIVFVERPTYTTALQTLRAAGLG